MLISVDVSEVTLSALNAPPDGDVDIEGIGDHSAGKIEFDSGENHTFYNNIIEYYYVSRISVNNYCMLLLVYFIIKLYCNTSFVYMALLSLVKLSRVN